MATPSPVINGTSGAYEQPVRYGWSESGPYIMRTWVGTLAAIEALIGTSDLNGATYEVRRGIGVHTLEARYSFSQGSGGGAGEVPIDSWEFMAGNVEKDILEADNSTINGITDDNKGVIRDRIANPGVDPLKEFVVDGSETDAESVWKLMLTGLRSIRVNSPVLRHTQTVSNLYAVKAALTHVGKVLTSATLANFEDIPGGVLFNLPNDVSTRTGLAYGWFKLHPTVRVAARQKMQIEIEYEYGLWSTLIYGTPL